METHRFFATAAKGTEGALRDELRALRLPRVKAERGGVRFEGPLTEGMRACMWTRLAQRVLLEVGAGAVDGAEDLYDLAASVPWEDWLTPQVTFAVHATGTAPGLDHTRFVALKTKDAVADRLRARFGRRPDVDPRHPDVPIAVHLRAQDARLYLDLAGDSLHLRGWRLEGGEAPLRETLAAAILALGGFDPERPLLDPMCGSGTIAIEAALMARRRAPGLGRRFAFHRWPTLGAEGQDAIARLEAEVAAADLGAPPAPVLARDHHAGVLELARENARRAGVGEQVRFEQRDARSLEPLPEGCQLFANPPYGERLGRRRLQLQGFFRAFAEAWRALPPGHPLVLLSGSPLLEDAFEQRPVLRHPLFNGPIECRLLRYEREDEGDE